MLKKCAKLRTFGSERDRVGFHTGFFAGREELFNLRMRFV